jgi:hypothetical protein
MRSHFMNMGAQTDAPAIVTTGLWAWHDAADASSITHEAGRVTEWQDKSGNGCDVYAAPKRQQCRSVVGRCDKSQ